MSNSFGIQDYPDILRDMLYRTRPNYITRFALQPDLVANSDYIAGEVYTMNRYGFLPDTGDMDIEYRTRSSSEILGTANTRQIPKETVQILLREITGPGSGDPNNPSLPGNLRLSVPDMKRAQERFWDMGFADPLITQQFHDSIGSTTLLNDYHMFMDRVYYLTAASTTYKYNPQGVADGGTYASGPPSFTVDDLDLILEQLITNQAPPFDDGLYHAEISPKMWSQLRRDPRFRENAVSAPYYPVGLVMALQENMFGPGIMPPANPNAMPVGWNKNPLSESPINHPSLINHYPYMGQVLPCVDEQMLPGGYIYNQFRIFVSNNIPTKQVQLTYTAVPSGYTDATGTAFRTAYPGIFFGKHAVGEIMGGDYDSGLPVTVKAHEGSDFGRYLILIWQAMLGIGLLNSRFVIEARAYGR